MSVQFSYPTLGGDAPSQGFFTYSDPTKNQYVSFTPTNISVINKQLYIQHVGAGGNIYIIFTLTEDSKASPLQDTKTNQIKLNNLISNELARKDSKFSLTGNVEYRYAGTAYEFSSGDHQFKMPGAIRVKSIKEFNQNAVSNILSGTPINIPLKPSITDADDLICDESEVDITTTSSTQTSGNTTLNIGVVMLSAFLLMGCLTLIKKFMPNLIIFDANTGLLQGFEDQKTYGIVTAIFFLLSFSLFITNGVIPNNYLLMFALVFLVDTIIMMWFKLAVFTAPALA